MGAEYDEAEAARGLAKALTVVLACILAVCLFGAYAGCGVEPDVPDPAYIKLDISNAALMHMHGLPTKEDVMHYHVSGTWGYSDGGRIRMYDELPGSTERWDELYGIEPNPAFKR